ncbi:putative zinc finger protein [Paenibacillus cellulosilyticus]|uniref:Anti-sigma-W factor RsiW n=1 Tax=Paenibacillus cellulosilyticus TaxID=375489 RepID=A0A2V2YX97_9BACL|nr:anti-sigma factor [Paenibacillus cellulosilyticus]PWW04808.1 putative zinc finger protein [Paenibacillus cellulosilyticus]QKS45928.1 anti-sigma factor [Paenibacillus cellulosilyticus]
MSDMDNNRKLCSMVLDFVSGDCTEEEASAFEAHLAGCAECQSELEELRVIWEVLPVDMDLIDPPTDLKQQVIESIFAADAEAYESKQSQLEPNHDIGKPITSQRSPRLRYVRIWAAAIVLVLAVGSIFGYQQIQSRAEYIPTLEDALDVSAAHIDQIVSLKPVSVTPDQPSYGVACIVDNGTNKQFIVYVFGAKETSGDQAYQVWLVDDGVRRSAGTFRVEEKMRGIGVLSMPIASDQLAFDAIGITLEPDDQGDQPRGTKVFGSAIS